MNLHHNSWNARARALLRAVRHAPDRLVHPLRRWRLRRRLRVIGLPRSVLFVCHGNICRSPYAQHAFFRRLPLELQQYMYVVSAGFTGPGRPAPRAGVAAAAARGVDLQRHRSQLMSGSEVALMDLVVVMDARQARLARREYGADRSRLIVLGDLDPRPIDTRAVSDPVLQPAEAFGRSYDRIDRCVEALLQAISGNEDARERLAAEAVAGGAAAAPAGSAADDAEAASADDSAADGEPSAAVPDPGGSAEGDALPAGQRRARREPFQAA